jgi:hypothetical protein
MRTALAPSPIEASLELGLRIVPLEWWAMRPRPIVPGRYQAPVGRVMQWR